MCCSPWGCRKVDMTELLNRTEEYHASHAFGGTAAYGSIGVVA